jgi:hypothetical protein
MSNRNDGRPRETGDIGSLEGYVLRERDGEPPMLELYGSDGGVSVAIDATRHATALEDIAHEIAAELGASTGDDEQWSRAPTPTGRWPPAFTDWPLGQQITEVKMQMTRSGLIRALLTQSGLDVDDVRFDRKLRKNELAAIYLNLEGIANVKN